LIIGQELDATVTINFEKLPTQNKEILNNFQNAIETYLNKTRFTGEDWIGSRIACTFNIFFTNAADEFTYTAQIYVVSQRPLYPYYQADRQTLLMNVFDEMWNFRYERNQSLQFNQTDFNPLTSLLDFYAYIIIGLDFDSFEPLSGSKYFSQAYSIAVLGSSSKYSEGWELNSKAYSRRGFVENLNNEKYQQFRIDYFEYHYNGVDILESQYRNIGQNNIVKLINNLSNRKENIDSRTVILKVFFDAKADEIVKSMEEYESKEIFEILKKLDPAHTSKWDEGLSAL